MRIHSYFESKTKYLITLMITRYKNTKTPKLQCLCPIMYSMYFALYSKMCSQLNGLRGIGCLFQSLIPAGLLLCYSKADLGISSDPLALLLLSPKLIKLTKASFWKTKLGPFSKYVTRSIYMITDFNNNNIYNNTIKEKSGHGESWRKNPW